MLTAIHFLPSLLMGIIGTNTDIFDRADMEYLLGTFRVRMATVNYNLLPKVGSSTPSQEGDNSTKEIVRIAKQL